MDNISATFSNVSEIYRDMVAKSVWDRNGALKYLLLEGTLVDGFALRSNELSYLYPNYQNDSGGFDASLILFRGSLNLGMFYTDFIDMNFITSYYVSQRFLNDPDPEEDEDTKKDKAYGDFNRNVLPGIMFSAKKFPVKFAISPLFNFNKNYETKKSKTEFEKILYNLSFNTYNSENLYIDLFINAALSNLGMSNMEDEAHDDEFSVSLNSIIYQKNMLDLCFYKERDVRYLETKYSIYEDVSSLLTFSEDYKLARANIEATIPFVVLIGNLNLGYYIQPSLDYTHNLFTDEHIYGFSCNIGFMYVSNKEDRTGLDCWLGAGSNRSEYVARNYNFTDRFVATMGVEFKSHNNTLMEYYIENNIKGLLTD